MSQPATTPQDLPIAVVDMGLYHTDRARFAQALGDGIRRVGFIGLTNHGVSEEVKQNAFAAAKAFFAQDEATKRQIYDPAAGGQRGYTPPNTEKAKDATVPDLKEFTHVGREFADGTPLPPLMQPNLWPQTPASYKPAMLALYQALEAEAQKVMAGIALYFGLPEDHFVSMLDRGDSILRPLHYPPIEDLETEAVRAGAHEDIDTITLLIGSDEPGLEVLTNDGDWLPITTLPGTIVCNVGDMLQEHTGGLLPSTTHRVTNPPGDHRKQPRYSIPFFYHYNDDVLLQTLPGLDAPQKEAPLYAHEYLLDRLEEIGLIDAAGKAERVQHAYAIGALPAKG